MHFLNLWSKAFLGILHSFGSASWVKSSKPRVLIASWKSNTVQLFAFLSRALNVDMYYSFPSQSVKKAISNAAIIGQPKIYIPVSEQSSSFSVSKSLWISFNFAKSSEVCVSNGFVVGILDGKGAGSKGTGISSTSLKVETTAWWNSKRSSPRKKIRRII